MLRVTLKDYKENYKADLKVFLAAYEDNSERYFFQKQFESYLEYYKVLIDISKRIKKQVNQGVREIVIDSVKSEELKRVNSSAYNNIIVKKAFKVQDSGSSEYLLEGTIPSKVIIKLDEFENHISSANAIMDYITIQLNNYSDSLENGKPKKDKKNYKDYVWFKVGLLFADGTMEKYYKVTDIGFLKLKDNFTAPKVAIDLGHEGYEKYILATLNNYNSNSDSKKKNIFSSREKMEKIIDHCNKKNIPINPYFISRLPSE
jgi:hypothetical protein